ncbi:hypothetical protein [Calothrix sp. 336/3]|uniref:hypothetical protein n=1 Tax=Calothrix sp. 336/3 TaxID=1337936 RepID=UPI00118758F8|nr:hypothetical protein [Calothrix sp. 336/3]
MPIRLVTKINNWVIPRVYRFRIPAPSVFADFESQNRHSLAIALCAAPLGSIALAERSSITHQDCHSLAIGFQPPTSILFNLPPSPFCFLRII